MILCGITNAFASKVDTLKVVSLAMNKTVSNVVIIPDAASVPENRISCSFFAPWSI